MEKFKQVTIYTDGACLGNPGPGGYGVMLLHQGHKRELSGGASHAGRPATEFTCGRGLYQRASGKGTLRKIVKDARISLVDLSNYAQVFVPR